MIDEHTTNSDSLLRVIIGAAIALAVLHAVVALVWGPGPVLAVLPWYVPAVESFGILAALSIAFLALGRYRVLQQPTPFWVGLAFGLFAVLSVFYILAFPGLLPDQRGIIAQSPNTSAWLAISRHSILSVFLLAAILAPWPRAGISGERWWFWLVLAALGTTIAIASLLVAFEQYLPLLIVDGVFTPLQASSTYVFVIVYGIGAALSAYRYRQTGDLLLGYASLTGMLLVFSWVAVYISDRRFDLIWYWIFILRIIGFTAMLFGLLSEYVGLYRREQEKTSELAELDRLKDQFLSVAAHELKTPVTGIKGYAQVLLRWEQEGISPRGLRALEGINRQADRIGRLVNELLETSRIQTGRLELNPTTFDLSELAAETVERMKIATEKHRLLFQSPGPALVDADSERIGEVLSTLLDNAVRFSPGGGDIETTVRLVDGEAVASVRDHGVGIPREKQARIFERFYRAHTGTPSDYGGMGVALSIAWEIVTRHGGRMWFESEEGKGSTFHFSLPAAASK